VDELKLSDHITSMLLDAGYMTAGDLGVQMRMDSDAIFALQGMSPKGMAEIEEALRARKLIPAGEVEEPAVEELVEAMVPATEEALVIEELTPVEEAALVTEETATEVSVVEEPEEELPTDLNEIFALKPEVLEAAIPSDEEDENSANDKKSGGKKKKKRHAEVEYDPDRDLVVVHKKHKRGESWGDW
jgi:N utilization substance protein A